MTPGIFPWKSRFRFCSFPVPTRRDAASSIMAISFPLLDEQRAHGILEMDPLDGLSQEAGHRQDPKLPARRLLAERYGVGDHHLLDRGFLEPLDRRPRENRMGGHGEDPLRPL